MNHHFTSFWLRNRGLIFQGVLLAAVWLFVSGKFETAYLFWGAVSTGLVLWFSHRLRKIPVSDDATATCVSRHISLPRLLLYLVWLLWQMIRSGVYVASLVLHPKLRIEPTIIRFTSRQPNVIARVILGNSITLTPGTLTLAISGNRFVVHALTRDTGEDPFNGEMTVKVCRLYSAGSGDEARCSELSIDEVVK
jgi:multicomponent Na+:H+ antiporter subunit E